MNMYHLAWHIPYIDSNIADWFLCVFTTTKCYVNLSKHSNKEIHISNVIMMDRELLSIKQNLTFASLI